MGEAFIILYAGMTDQYPIFSEKKTRDIETCLELSSERAE